MVVIDSGLFCVTFVFGVILVCWVVWRCVLVVVR